MLQSASSTVTQNPSPDFFFNHFDLEEKKTLTLVESALHGCDDGELYLEYTASESLALSDDRLKSSSSTTSHGFGLRGVCGEAVGYAHSTLINHEDIARAGQNLLVVKDGYTGVLDQSPHTTPHALYEPTNRLGDYSYQDKVALLEKINAYIRGKSDKVSQVAVGLSGTWKAISILRPDGVKVTDFRPLIRFTCSVIARDGEVQEVGYYGRAGRFDYAEIFNHWQKFADDALRQVLLKLGAKPAPAGVMPVVLAAGEPGVILHEAVGHGLEGDFNRKKTSAFHDKMGHMVAAKGVTVIDNGTIDRGMGSLNVDDEGTPTQRNVLIEDGKLVGLMQDRQNARLMGMKATGNGRRESYAHLPMPRMTNTYMENGPYAKEELFKGIKRGIYAVDMGGGMVDITSGKYVFTVTEGYMIENGHITHPIKNATLTGDGPSDLLRVRKVAGDLALDPGGGACGKGGQWVPVHTGQPSILIDDMTVGGTA